MATTFEQLAPGINARTLATGYRHLRLHYTADPRKDELWAKKKAMSYGGLDSPKWRREFELDYYAVEGQRVYPMLSSIHIEPKNLSTPGEWSFFRILDYGLRHPTVCLWVAVNANGDRHVYREFYCTDHTIESSCKEILRRSTEKTFATWIDPATRARIPLSRDDKQPISVASEFQRCLGTGLQFADNSRTGYDTVKQFLLATLAMKANREGMDESSYLAKEYFSDYGVSASEFTGMINRPKLTFDPDCTRVYRELSNLRFKPLTGDPTNKAEPEDVVDFEDDGPDCVRYACQSMLSHGLYQTKWAARAEPGSPLYEARQKYEQNKARQARRKIGRPSRTCVARSRLLAR